MRLEDMSVLFQLFLYFLNQIQFFEKRFEANASDKQQLYQMSFNESYRSVFYGSQNQNGPSYPRVHTENIGLLSRVFLDDIVQEQNLDYLENLAQMVENMSLHPMWLEQESGENKVKLLRIYQLSLSYAFNTGSMFESTLHQISGKVSQLRNANEKKKKEIIQYKSEIGRIKKKYKRMTLNIEKKRLHKYQNRMIQLKKDLLSKFENYEHSYTDSHTSHQPPPPQIVYIPSPYHQPQGYSQQIHPPSVQPQPFPVYHQPPPFQYPQPPAMNVAKQKTQSEGENKNRGQEIGSQRVASSKRKLSDVISGRNQNFSLTTSKVVVDENEDDDDDIEESVILKKEMVDDNQLSNIKSSDTGKFFRNSNPWTAGNRSIENILTSQEDQIKEVNGSEMGDLVLPLEEVPKKISVDLSSELSKKESSESDEIGSLIQVKLGAVSKKKIKIKEEEENQSSIFISNVGKDPVNPKFNNNAVKLKESGGIENSNSPYLLVSNQGKNKPEIKQINNLTIKSESNTSLFVSNQKGTVGENKFENNNLKLKESHQVEKRLTHSIEQSYNESPRKEVKNQELIDEVEQNYESVEFQDFDQSSPEVQVDISSPQNDLKKKAGSQKYVQLVKKSFILRGQTQELHSSVNSSNIGSLQELTIRLSRFKKGEEKESDGGHSRLSEFDLIDIPLNSHVARPSKLKNSTIVKKSQVVKHNKLHKSDKREDPVKSPEKKEEDSQQKQPSMIKVRKEILSSVNNKETIQRHNQSQKKERFPKQAPNNLAESHLSLEMTDSFLMNSEDQQEPGREKEAPIDKMSAIEQAISEKADEESFELQLDNPSSPIDMEKQKIRKRIELLIENKEKQVCEGPFDSMVIKAEIKKNISDQDEENLTWENVIAIFKNKVKKKKNDIKIKTQKLKEKQAEKQKREQITKSYAMEKKSKKFSSERNEKSDDELNYSQSLVEIHKSRLAKEHEEKESEAQSQFPQSKIRRSSNVEGKKENESNIKSDIEMKEVTNQRLITSENEEQKQKIENKSPKSNGGGGSKSVPKFARPTAKNDHLGTLKQRSQYNRDDAVEQAVKDVLNKKAIISDDDFDD